jgi:hypothetical protein
LPDGLDTDSNCTDFQVQAVATLASASAAGATNIKVASVDGFSEGQTILIDTGGNLETAVIATVGTPGASTLSAATAVGATVVPVASAAGFAVGQTITIGSRADRETAVIASLGRGAPAGRGGQGATITIATPLTKLHAVGAEIYGSGITLTKALTHAHDSGAQVTDALPTPGAPNRFHGRAH